MGLRIGTATLGVDDLNRLCTFHYRRLSFPTTRTPDRDIIFSRTDEACLAFFPREKLTED
jgi:hypothetical protein